MAHADKSNGYEQVASVYIAGRGSNPSGIGASVALTEQTSISLGYDAYQEALDDEGMSLLGTHLGVGDNHYYFAQKR